MRSDPRDIIPGDLVRTRGRTDPIGGFLTMWDGRWSSFHLGTVSVPIIKVPGDAVGLLVGFEQGAGSKLALVHYPQGLCMWWVSAFELAEETP